MRSLGYIDQTLYANEGNSSRVTWRNDEVLELLRDVRAMIVDDVEPPLQNTALAALPAGLGDKPVAAALEVADAYLDDPSRAGDLLAHVQELDKHSTVMINALLLGLARARRGIRS